MRDDDINGEPHDIGYLCAHPGICSGHVAVLGFPVSLPPASDVAARALPIYLIRADSPGISFVR